MKRFAFGSLMTHVAFGSALIGLLPQQPAAGVTIDVVPVGNPGNSADDTGFGTGICQLVVHRTARILNTGIDPVTR